MKFLFNLYKRYDENRKASPKADNKLTPPNGILWSLAA